MDRRRLLTGVAIAALAPSLLFVKPTLAYSEEVIGWDLVDLDFSVFKGRYGDLWMKFTPEFATDLEYCWNVTVAKLLEDIHTDYHKYAVLRADGGSEPRGFTYHDTKYKRLSLTVSYYVDKTGEVNAQFLRVNGNNGRWGPTLKRL
jgi:hypothetical protein